MQKKTFGWTLRIMTVLALAVGTGAVAQYWGSDRLPVSFSGQINAYTPTTTKAPTGPYEIRGPWSMQLKRDGTLADFSTELNMVLSDGWVLTNGTTPPNFDPTTRNAHTHHITMKDGVVTDNWASSCPSFSPAVVGGFVVSGTATITGNGGPAPFGNPSPLTICVLGGNDVTYSNVTLTFGLPASGHFGKQAVHGVVLTCTGLWGHELNECTLQE